MKTQCPHCETVFRISQQQLTQAYGRVRCGYCNELFDAHVHLVNVDQASGASQDKSAPISPAAGSAVSRGDKESARSPVAIHPLRPSEKETADGPSKKTSPIPAPVFKIDKQDEFTQDTSDTGFGQGVAEQDAGSFGSAVMEAPPDAPKLRLEDIENTDLIPPHWRSGHAVSERHYNPVNTLLWTLGILGLLVVLVVQYAYFNRNELFNHPEMRPYLVKLCAFTGCELPELRDLDSIELLDRSVYSHPNVENALMISGALRNGADFPQVLPKLQISFFNVRGEMVASRTFSPEEYLTDSGQSLSKMPPGALIPIALEMADPGEEGMTYEFDFH